MFVFQPCCFISSRSRYPAGFVGKFRLEIPAFVSITHYIRCFSCLSFPKRKKEQGCPCHSDGNTKVLVYYFFKDVGIAKFKRQLEAPNKYQSQKNYHEKFFRRGSTTSRGRASKTDQSEKKPDSRSGPNSTCSKSVCRNS